jgi:hypothetical protein
MWTSTRSRKMTSLSLCMNQLRSPSPVARFGDGGLDQKRDEPQHQVTSRRVARALGRLGTLPRCTAASAWRCQLVSLHILVANIFRVDAVMSVFIGSGVSMVLQEWRLTNDFTRFALLATTPFLFCVSLVSSRSVASRAYYSRLSARDSFSRFK